VPVGEEEIPRRASERKRKKERDRERERKGETWRGRKRKREREAGRNLTFPLRSLVMKSVRLA